MNTVEILSRQTEDAYQWTNKVLDSVPLEKWDNIPDQVETNISWQAGHLIMSIYYHSIMVISGHRQDVIEKVPLKIYNELFTAGDPRKAVGKVEASFLKDQLAFVQQKSIEVIRSLSTDDLEKELEPTKMPHPIANTKFEALDWNVKHVMWHCGQMGMLKRIIHQRYDFGLKF